MGKPSSASFSKNNSECSIHSHSRTGKIKGKAALSAYKMEQIKKKNHKHVRKNIHKLFNKLQKDSRNASLDNTKTSSDSTPRNLTIVVKNDSFHASPTRKRKSPVTLSGVAEIPSKSRKKSDSLIVITDDDATANDDSCVVISPPRKKSSNINCSTPIAARDTKTLQNLIINNFPNCTDKQNCTEDLTTDDNNTRIINRDSFLTIDLTADSENKTNGDVTVIDVEKTGNITNDSQDCTLVSVSHGSLSMSGDSDVTVIQNSRRKNIQIKKVTNGIAQLNASEKGKLLEYITRKIFSGTDVGLNLQSGLQHICASRGTGTDEDVYIKEVILGEKTPEAPKQSNSRNSIGSNIYHPSRDLKNTTGLRMVVIDGSNVAMEHTKGRMFSVEGLKICIDYFVRRGHVVKAFVPRFRCKYGKSSDPKLLDLLERQGLVVYTPSREIQGKTCVPYDDRYILQCAAEFDGVVVSGDNYKDLINENKRWRYIIENRILPFTWVNNMIMFPKDPFGRGGPTLETLLKHPTPSNSQVVAK
uniref:RNase NYN domain-containing protein n=2 Tax=Heliothis virescens TaxID=7102 RepID=A0A2A4JRD3_HELVI